MDWTGLGLRDRIVEWLESAANARYTQDRRLDPFATSMRDFDDASAHLKTIRGGNPPDTNDPGQRVVDLKKAGFVDSSGQALTAFGAAVLDAWEHHGVDSDAKTDELARLLLMALEAQKIGDPDFQQYFEYWSDLRTYFDPLELIQNWEALYQINYLDFERDGFFPGATYREEQVSVSDIDYDLADYARAAGASALAIKGGDRIFDGIRGKVPRGRHRATFCMALEIVLSDGKSAPAILENFGYPRKPMVWTPFVDAQKAQIDKILDGYGVTAIIQIGPFEAPPAAAATDEGLPFVAKPAPELPTEIDFSNVLIEPPKPKAKTVGGGGKGSGPKKTDHKEKAKANDAVGKLGEDFAIAYERWRLREHPELLKMLRHASEEDDTLGYDIESFELDGTPRFVEVKGTLGPMETRFFLSANELSCAESKGEHYIVLRVAQLASDPKCCEIRYPFDGKLELTPETYRVIFASEVGGAQ